MDNFNPFRICEKCSLWAPNGMHPKSEEYKGHNCLERLNNGITYRTEPEHSCYLFQPVKSDPMIKPTPAENPASPAQPVV